MSIDLEDYREWAGEYKKDGKEPCLRSYCNHLVREDVNKTTAKNIRTGITTRKQKTLRYKKLILDYLKNQYDKTGRDFFFKSKHIKLPISNITKGQIVKKLAETKNPKVIHWSVFTFKTNFENNGE